MAGGGKGGGGGGGGGGGVGGRPVSRDSPAVKDNSPWDSSRLPSSGQLGQQIAAEQQEGENGSEPVQRCPISNCFYLTTKSNQ